MKNKNQFTTIAGMILSCALFASGCAGGQNVSQAAGEQETLQISKEPTTQEPTTENRFLQSFEADTLDGGTFTQEDFAQKDVTIINFWATFCGPCLAEMPDLAEFEKSLPDNVQLITACLDGEGDTEGVKSILNDAGYEGITLLGGTGDYQAVCGQVLYIPTTVLVDQNGNMLGDAIIGGQTDLAETYRTAVNDALQSMGKAEIGDETN